MDQSVDAKIEDLKSFLREEFYKRTADELEELDKDFKQAAKKSGTTAITEVILSEDTSLLEKLYKEHRDAPLGALTRLFYLVKLISPNLIWTGFNMIGKKENRKMLITLRPIRTNMKSLQLIEQIYTALTKDFHYSTALVITKYEFNSNVSVDSRILTEGLVSLVKSGDKYDLYFYNMFDKTEFDMLLSTVLGLPTYLRIINKCYYYVGTIAEFSKDLKKMANDIVTDDLMMQSTPVDVLRWFNNRMGVKSDNLFGVQFCSETGIPLVHFGEYHENNRSKFYV